MPPVPREGPGPPAPGNIPSVPGSPLSRDPKPGHVEKPRTLHKYLYASADGVNRIDPRGKEDLVEEDLEQDEESKAEEEGEEAAADKIDCILNASGDAFDAWTAIESGDVLGAASGATSLAADWETCAGSAKGKKAGCCFAAGTPVHTDHGDVPVEKVEVGDEVFSRNRETGQLESQPVTALTPPHQDKLIEMRIEGERTPLRPSTSHPFWLKRGDALPAWMPAGQMRLEDSVQSLQGDWRRVVSISPLQGQETVYNFTVDQNHDYFVGETGFLVHNQNCDICKIENHLNRPELEALDHPPNDRMLQRLEDGFDSPWDRNFAEHELIESGLMDGGMGASEAHLLTLERQGIPYKAGYQRYLYHPDVIEEFPEMFNPACRNPL